MKARDSATSENLLQSFSEDSYLNAGDNGFSLLELVTAVGVVLILAMIGLTSFNTVTGNAKQAAVNRAAQEVYNKAYAYVADGANNTDPESVETEYNNSQGAKKKIRVVVDVLEADRLKVTAFMDNGKYEAVRQTSNSLSSGDSGVIGDSGSGGLIVSPGAYLSSFTYKCDSDETGYLPLVNVGASTKVYMWETNDKENTFEEVKYKTPQIGVDYETGKDANGRDNEDKFIRTEAREDIFKTQLFTEYQNKNPELTSEQIWSKVRSAKDSSGKDIFSRDVWREASINDTTAYSVGKTIKNVSARTTMKAGVEYKIRYDGDVETFTSPGANDEAGGGNQGLSKCLRSIDSIGNSTNLKNIVYIGAPYLENVPDSIPDTVLSLRSAFENATEFNDESVKLWDVTNIKSMKSMFYNATKFNQDLSSWKTGNVETMRSMFSGATSFNQNISENGAYWNTESLLDTNSMFAGASSFNNGCATGQYTCPLKWRTDKLSQLSAMFMSSSFNQNISENGVYWKLTNAQGMNKMFYNNTAFNNGVPKGSESVLTWNFQYGSMTFKEMFQGASSFNQNLNGWTIKANLSADQKSNFATGSGLLCNNIPTKLRTLGQCEAG